MGSKWKRKLSKSKTGHQYNITLPIEWVRYHSLKPGDSLEIVDDEKGLHIKPEK